MDSNSVLIIDDHPVIQIGLSSLINRHNLFAVTDIAVTGKEALSKIRKKNIAKDIKKNYDILIIDINLPDYTIFNLLKKIKNIDSSIPILILSALPPKTYISKLIGIGINGYISKMSTDKEIINAINLIKTGRKYFSQEALDAMIDSKKIDSNENDSFEKLSHREFEIMLFLSDGKSVGEISKTLNLHKSSVATYKKRIFQKLKVDNIIELFQLAKENQLVS